MSFHGCHFNFRFNLSNKHLFVAEHAHSLQPQFLGGRQVPACVCSLPPSARPKAAPNVPTQPPWSPSCYPSAEHFERSGQLMEACLPGTLPTLDHGRTPQPAHHPPDWVFSSGRGTGGLIPSPVQPIVLWLKAPLSLTGPKPPPLALPMCNPPGVESPTEPRSLTCYPHLLPSPGGLVSTLLGPPGLQIQLCISKELPRDRP